MGMGTGSETEGTQTEGMREAARREVVSALATAMRVRGVVAAVMGTGVSLMAGTIAMADDRFTPESILEAAGERGDAEFTEVNGSWINTRVTSIAGWLLGVAIAIFVLRIILTAVDRMILGGDGNAKPTEKVVGNVRYFKPTGLAAIPLIGAYPVPDDFGNGYTWKQVWINFAKNLAICIGAWVLVNAMVGLVSWLMTEGIGGVE